MTGFREGNVLNWSSITVVQLGLSLAHFSYYENIFHVDAYRQILPPLSGLINGCVLLQVLFSEALRLLYIATRD